MPNPGAFRGSRKEFLLGEKEAYKQAVDGNYTSEALALIYRRFFKRFPIDSPYTWEPTSEELAAVNDNAPDDEIPEPDIFALSREEYDKAMVEVRRRKKDIEFRKGQIKRWMAYQYMKDHHVDPKATGVNNLYRLLLCKLTNVSVNRPRRKTPVNVWRKSKRNVIDLEVKRKHGHVGKENMAAIRDKIACDIFASMNKNSRHKWEVLAKEEHQVALDQWNKAMEAPPSTKPEDRQQAIQGLVSFVQPILDMICDATGWKVSLIAGGPEPAQDGQLNVISIHSGTTSGDVKMTFSHAERANIKKYLIPMFGTFLQKCYSPEECRSHALSSHEGHLRVSQLDIESANITIHNVARRNRNDNKSGGSTAPSVPTPKAPTISTSASEHGESTAAPPGTMSDGVLAQESTIPSPSVDPASVAISSASGGAVAAGPTIANPLSDVDQILEAEGDTLTRITAPPEDEIEMISSPSPVSSPRSSPPPSPAPSRCPSPSLTTIVPAEPEPCHPVAPTTVDTATSPEPSDGTHPESAEALKSDGTKKRKRNHVAVPPTTAQDGSNLSPGRPRRIVRKTAKMMLMEVSRGRRQSKQQVPALGNGDSTANQGPAVKRSRVGRKGK